MTDAGQEEPIKDVDIMGPDDALREQQQFFMQQNRLAAVGETINYIIHQWRQPLNAIAIRVQIMKDAHDAGECSNEFMDQSVQQIINLIGHMTETIDDFRNFIRPEQDMKQFNLKDVVGRILVLFGDIFKDCSIKVDMEAEEDLIVTGYSNEYCQMILNILNNARDALMERSVCSPQVVIRLFREGNRKVATISDNAGGISESIMSRIFEPYFTTKDASKGTGIGLYISKVIIEKRMNGKISVRNTEQGAEFRIEM
jgi:signal transduction histidine kinase